MNSIKVTSILFVCLVASFTSAAPTETSAGQTSEISTEAIAAASATTPIATPTTTVATTTIHSASPATEAAQSASAPATDNSAKEANTTAPMVSAHEQVINTTSFTCYGRSIGYYADIEQECKVYHFCLLGEYNGEPVYQRISYLCLNNTIFDQQALDCVDFGKISSPCKESVQHYENSNAILRQSIVGSKMHQGAEKTTAATPVETPASS